MVQQRVANALAALYKLVTEATTITEEVSVDFVVIAVLHTAKRAVTFACRGVAAQATMDTNGGRHLKVPLARVVAFESCIREYARRADLDQIAAELAFQNAVFMSPIVDAVAQMKRIQITAACIFTIKPHAPLTLNAAIHLVIHERAEILIAKRSLAKAVTARAVTGHHRHVLKMAFATFLTNRAIVRMVLHQALNHCPAKGHGLSIRNGNARAFSGWRHACHHELSCCVLLVAELLN